MSQYPLVELGEVVEINPRFNRTLLDHSSDVSFVPMAAVCDDFGSIVAPKARPFREVSKGFTIFAERDVLFAKITPCMENGKAAIAKNLLNGTGAGSTEFYVIRPSDKILPEFIFHFVRRKSFRDLCKANFTGSAGQQRVPKSFLQRVQIPLPGIEDQRRLVRLLNRASAIRWRAKTARSKERSIISSLFVDMFGDPSQNPNNWPVEHLSTIADIGSGLTKGRKLKNHTTEMVPYLRVANVQDGFLDLSEVKLIRATVADVEKCKLLPGDLLMTEGGDPDKLGRCAIWNGEIPNCLHQNHVFRVRVGDEVLPNCAASYIQSIAGKSYFLRVAKRTTGIASINKTQLGQLPIMLPPIVLQEIFSKRVEQLRQIFAGLDQAATKAEFMAAALSAKVFG